MTRRDGTPVLLKVPSWLRWPRSPHAPGRRRGRLQPGALNGDERFNGAPFAVDPHPQSVLDQIGGEQADGVQVALDGASALVPCEEDDRPARGGSLICGIAGPVRFEGSEPVC